MNDSNATEVIIGSVVVIAATTIVKNALAKTQAGKTWEPAVYGVVLMLALLAIAIVAPKFAKGLAYLGLVGAFAVNGPAIFKAVGALPGPGNTKRTVMPAAPTGVIVPRRGK